AALTRRRVRAARALPAGGTAPADGAAARARRARMAERTRAVTAVVAAFAVLGTLHVAYTTRDEHPDWDQAALDTPGADGVIAPGTALQRRANGPSAQEIRDAVTRLSGGREPGDLVVLTDVHSLLAFYPYRGFQTVTSAYANP